MIITFRQSIKATKIAVATFTVFIMLAPMAAFAVIPSSACIDPSEPDPSKEKKGCVCDQGECDALCESSGICQLTLDNDCALVKTCPDPEPDAPATSGSQSFKPKVLENPLTVDSIPKVIGRAIQIFTGVSGSVALLMFVYGSFLLMTSRGEQEKVKKGKDAMKMAVLGLIIIFTAYAVLNLLFESIGAS